MLRRAWTSFSLRVTHINPFIGYPSQRERGLSRDPPSLFTPPSVAGSGYLPGFFRTMSEKPPKQMKGLGRKLLNRRRHHSLARTAIKSGKRIEVAHHRNDNISIHTRCQSEQRRPKADSSTMRSPPVHASHWKLIAETFKTSFQLRCYIYQVCFSRFLWTSYSTE